MMGTGVYSADPRTVSSAVAAGGRGGTRPCLLGIVRRRPRVLECAAIRVQIEQPATTAITSAPTRSTADTGGGKWTIRQHHGAAGCGLLDRERKR